MAGLDEIGKKAQQFLQSDQFKDAMKSEQAEGASDKVFDALAGAADKVTGGKHHEQIEKAREEADKRVGDS